MASKKHAEIIKQWLDGAKVQFYEEAIGDWKDAEQDQPGFYSHVNYRIKPAEPERMYPVTQMTSIDLNDAYGQKIHSDSAREQARRIANAALRHAIDAGQVVTREEFDRMCGDRKARDMAVAKAVRDAHFKREGNTMIFRTPSDDCLAAIIAEVQS